MTNDVMNIFLRDVTPIYEKLIHIMVNRREETVGSRVKSRSFLQSLNHAVSGSCQAKVCRAKSSACVGIER
jgi:hypothetical protein